MTGLALRSIEGTLPEKVTAFQQIAANAAQSGLMPSGYDNVPKILAACWGADALGVHPMVYMQGVHVAFFNGRVMLEPKWEFLNGLMRARLPGFDYKVLQNDELACEIEFTAEDRQPQKVRYTIEDAERQGFANKDTYKTHTVEMLWKQAFKRGADRIGSDVLMGLPTMTEVFVETPEPAAKPRTSAAEVLEAAAEPGKGEPGEHGTDAKPSAPPPPDYHELLSESITMLWGASLKKADKLAKCGLIMSQITGVTTLYKRADQIGPEDARQMYEFLKAKYPTGKLPGPDDIPAPEAEVVAEDDEVPEPDDDLTPPPVELAVSKGTEAKQELYATFEGFAQLCRRAEAQFKERVFMESPIGSGKWWLVRKSVLDAYGFAQSVCIQKAGALQQPEDTLVKMAVTIEQEIAAAQNKGGRA